MRSSRHNTPNIHKTEHRNATQPKIRRISATISPTDIYLTALNPLESPDCTLTPLSTVVDFFIAFHVVGFWFDLGIGVGVVVCGCDLGLFLVNCFIVDSLVGGVVSIISVVSVVSVVVSLIIRLLVGCLCGHIRL